jgi:hypothetical protein
MWRWFKEERFQLIKKYFRMKNNFFLKINILVLILTSALFACKNDPKEQKNTETPSVAPAATLPNTPETVVRTWQTDIDHNQFEEAKALSTDRMKGYIERVIMAVTASDAAIINTDLQNLQCTTEADSSKAVCIYSVVTLDTIATPPYPKGTKLLGKAHVLENNFTDKFNLVKQNGQWLIDNDKDAELQNILNGK